MAEPSRDVPRAAQRRERARAVEHAAVAAMAVSPLMRDQAQLDAIWTYMQGSKCTALRNMLTSEPVKAEVKAELCRSASMLTLKEGTVLFRQGEPCTSYLYFILTGGCDVRHKPIAKRSSTRAMREEASRRSSTGTVIATTDTRESPKLKALMRRAPSNEQGYTVASPHKRDHLGCRVGALLAGETVGEVIYSSTPPELRKRTSSVVALTRAELSRDGSTRSPTASLRDEAHTEGEEADTASTGAGAVVPASLSSSGPLETKLLQLDMGSCRRAAPRLFGQAEAQLKHRVSLLRRLHAFRSTPRDELVFTAQWMSDARAPSGTEIFKQGDTVGAVYVLESGSVGLSRKLVAPKAVVNVEHVVAPGFFGELELVGGEVSRRTSAVAVADCSMYSVPSHVFSAMCVPTPGSGAPSTRLTRFVAEREAWHHLQEEFASSEGYASPVPFVLCTSTQARIIPCAVCNQAGHPSDECTRAVERERGVAKSRRSKGTPPAGPPSASTPQRSAARPPLPGPTSSPAGGAAPAATGLSLRITQRARTSPRSRSSVEASAKRAPAPASQFAVPGPSSPREPLPVVNPVPPPGAPREATLYFEVPAGRYESATALQLLDADPTALTRVPPSTGSAARSPTAAAPPRPASAASNTTGRRGRRRLEPSILDAESPSWGKGSPPSAHRSTVSEVAAQDWNEHGTPSPSKQSAAHMKQMDRVGAARAASGELGAVCRAVKAFKGLLRRHISRRRQTMMDTVAMARQKAEQDRKDALASATAQAEAVDAARERAKSADRPYTPVAGDLLLLGRGGNSTRSLLRLRKSRMNRTSSGRSVNSAAATAADTASTRSSKRSVGHSRSTSAMSNGKVGVEQVPEESSVDPLCATAPAALLTEEPDHPPSDDSAVSAGGATTEDASSSALEDSEDDISLIPASALVPSLEVGTVRARARASAVRGNNRTKSLKTKSSKSKAMPNPRELAKARARARARVKAKKKLEGPIRSDNAIASAQQKLSAAAERRRAAFAHHPRGAPSVPRRAVLVVP